MLAGKKLVMTYLHKGEPGVGKTWTKFTTGQSTNPERGTPGPSREEIEWAQDLGAKSDDEVMEYIQLHKRNFKE